MSMRLAFAALSALILPAMPAAACSSGCGGGGYGYTYAYAQPAAAPVMFAPVAQAPTYYAMPQPTYGYYPAVAQTAYPAYGYYGYAPRPRRYARAYYAPRPVYHRPMRPRYTK